MNRRASYFQEAMEDGFARRLLGRLNPPAPEPRSRRPAVQAVFCIDVRSEPLRRHLESQSDAVETLGLRRVLRRPARLAGRRLACTAPDARQLLRPVGRRPVARRRADRLRSAAAVKQLQAAPAAAFNFVEVMGLAYGLGLAADALGLRPSKRSDEVTSPIDLEADVPRRSRADGGPPSARRERS